MRSNIETQTSSTDVFKWLIIVVLVAVGVISNDYYSAEPMLYRLIAILVIACIISFLALQTVRGKEFFILAKEAQIEIRRVVWPTRQETVQTTTIVLAVVFFMSFVLWGVDSLLGWIVSSVIN